jgi:hypothetical protein
MYADRPNAKLNVKLVYAGDVDAARVSVTQLHAAVGTAATELIEAGGVLAFDFDPPHLGTLDGWKIRPHVYTAAGMTPFHGLPGADGILFLAGGDAATQWDALMGELRRRGEKPSVVVGLLAGCGWRAPEGVATCDAAGADAFAPFDAVMLPVLRAIQGRIPR